MKIRSMLPVALILLMTTGCYFPISGKVVDAETNAPIEGAVVLVEWTKTHGIGDRSTEVYKVQEIISDKEGNISLEGCNSPFINSPRLTIYKQGYVAWNNTYIFPTFVRRANFSWHDNVTISLQTFSSNLSRKDHVFFLHTVTHWGKLINAAYRWEELDVEGQK